MAVKEKKVWDSLRVYMYSVWCFSHETTPNDPLLGRWGGLGDLL